MYVQKIQAGNEIAKEMRNDEGEKKGRGEQPAHRHGSDRPRGLQAFADLEIPDKYRDQVKETKFMTPKPCTLDIH